MELPRLRSSPAGARASPELVETYLTSPIEARGPGRARRAQDDLIVHAGELPRHRRSRPESRRRPWRASRSSSGWRRCARISRRARRRRSVQQLRARGPHGAAAARDQRRGSVHTGRARQDRRRTNSCHACRACRGSPRCGTATAARTQRHRRVLRSGHAAPARHRSGVACHCAPQCPPGRTAGPDAPRPARDERVGARPAACRRGPPTHPGHRPGGPRLRARRHRDHSSRRGRRTATSTASTGRPRCRSRCTAKPPPMPSRRPPGPAWRSTSCRGRCRAGVTLKVDERRKLGSRRRTSRPAAARSDRVRLGVPGPLAHAAQSWRRRAGHRERRNRHRGNRSHALPAAHSRQHADARRPGHGHRHPRAERPRRGRAIARGDRTRPTHAPLAGSRIATAVLGSTLTTTVVLLPFLYLQGNARAMFAPFAAAFAMALFWSVATALMFVPAVGRGRDGKVSRLAAAGSPVSAHGRRDGAVAVRHHRVHRDRDRRPHLGIHQESPQG